MVLRVRGGVDRGVGSKKGGEGEERRRGELSSVASNGSVTDAAR